MPAFDPATYDLLQPATFGPFAAALTGRVPVLEHGAVLELACGTGAVTRPLRRHLPRGVELVATDLNPAMLEHARAQLADLEGISWRVADMLALPFEDGQFAGGVCGFGMMFPPDKPAAFAQVRRVLAPGATFAFSTWDGLANNAHGRTVARAIEDRFPGDPDMRFGTPYEMNDQGAIAALLDGAGFTEVQVESVRLPVGGISPLAMARGMILGTPRSALIAQRGVDPHEVVAQAAEALRTTGGDPYAGHAQALVVRAQAG